MNNDFPRGLVAGFVHDASHTFWNVIGMASTPSRSAMSASSSMATTTSRSVASSVASAASSLPTTTSRSAANSIPASEIQSTPYDRNLDTIPPHQLQPCLKSICEELKKLRQEVKQMQGEQKRMSASMAQFF